MAKRPNANEWYKVKDQFECRHWTSAYKGPYDVISKTYNEKQDRFDYKRYTDCYIVTEYAEDEEPMSWKLNSGGLVYGRVVAVMLNPKWEEVVTDARSIDDPCPIKET